MERNENDSSTVDKASNELKVGKKNSGDGCGRDGRGGRGGGDDWCG